MQRLPQANPAGALDVTVFTRLTLDEEVERDIHPVHEPSSHEHSFRNGVLARS